MLLTNRRKNEQKNNHEGFRNLFLESQGYIAYEKSDLVVGVIDESECTPNIKTILKYQIEILRLQFYTNCEKFEEIFIFEP